MCTADQFSARLSQKVLERIFFKLSIPMIRLEKKIYIVYIVVVHFCVQFLPHMLHNSTIKVKINHLRFSQSYIVFNCFVEGGLFHRSFILSEYNVGTGRAGKLRTNNRQGTCNIKYGSVRETNNYYLF